MPPIKSRIAAAFAVFACPAAMAQAQHASRQAPTPESFDSGARVVYESDFYQRFQPQTAMDLLQQTPGFSLDAPDGDLLRGFAANAGNVLIDGQRPTIKSGGLTAYLGRIGAARVARVELIRGALTGEAQGHTLVANLVLVEGGGRSGNASFELRRAPADRITPKLEASYALPAGQWQLSAGITAFYERNLGPGRYQLFDAAGRRTAIIDEALAQNEAGTTINGSAVRPVAGGQISINGRYAWFRERYRQALTPLEAVGTDTAIVGRNVVKDGELGADWVRPLGKGWGLKLVGLARTGTKRFSESFAQNEESAFALDASGSELVARVSAYRDSAHWLRPELVAELAWNRLSSRFVLIEGGLPVALPGSDVWVTELRGEVAASLSARLSKTLRIEAGTAYERTAIDVAGELAKKRKLGFWKPSAAVVWDPDARTQLRLGWRRTVGQLDLAGFAATGNLIDDRPIAGNSELRPEITDAWSFKADRRFGSKGGALSLTLARETIRDALAYVPLISGGEALLNFGRVKLWSLSGEATIPLDRWLSGARITANGNLTRARRPDPFGWRRPDSRDFKELDLAFRQDLVRLRSAFGFTVAIDANERQWYVAEYQQTHFRPYVTAYVETAALPGFKTTLTASGIAGDRHDRLRLFYSPDRSGLLAGSERRRRERGVYVNLLLARQF